MTSNTQIVQLTADIITAFISHNQTSVDELTQAIKQTRDCLIQLTEVKQPEVVVPLVPAVPVGKSVTADFIICLENGQKFKSLKKHLHSQYGMTPDQYRRKWGLPHDYPMTAPNYSLVRSNLAKASRLGG